MGQDTEPHSSSGATPSIPVLTVIELVVLTTGTNTTRSPTSATCLHACENSAQHKFCAVASSGVQVAGNGSAANGQSSSGTDELATPELKRCASAPPANGARAPLPVLPTFVLQQDGGHHHHAHFQPTS